MVYPGGCRSKTGEGSAYSVAVPADPTDKLLKKWDRLHPIINDTDNDPSEAWQTPHGEWRMTGHGGGDGGAPMWATADPTMMTGWYKIGSSPLPTGECQNFFELPPFYPGTTANNAPLPNFVHITSSTYQLGTWVEGTPGVGNNHTGDWNATAGVPFFRVGTDGGNSYAAKGFWDNSSIGVGGGLRRIIYAWSRGTHPDCQSLPRVITYHPGIKRLVFTPAPELKLLRQ